ncbi:zinc finger, CCHC-type containing protein, partial [Tanacetum coccineum]
MAVHVASTSACGTYLLTWQLMWRSTLTFGWVNGPGRVWIRVESGLDSGRVATCHHLSGASHMSPPEWCHVAIEIYISPIDKAGLEPMTSRSRAQVQPPEPTMLEHRSISTWEDLTTRFLAQFFPPGRTAKLRNDILMFQQHQGKYLFEAWTRFKDLLRKVPHHGIDRWLQIQIFYDHVSFHLKCESDRAGGGKLRDKNTEESWEII